VTRKQGKTNAMRMLESKGIAYTPHHFSPDIHSAQGVAEALGLPPGQVFKTLVVVSDGGRSLLAMVPGDQELDLKRLARAAGRKRLRMASQREAESLTRLRVGGISPLALPSKGFAVFLDASSSDHDEILVSAGQRGINLRIGVDDLVEITGARIAAISRRGSAAGQ